MVSLVKVLVLEDDPNMRAVLAQVLAAQGFEVTAVGRGEEAVEQARARTFDLIVADIRMEGMDGLDAVAQARELQPNVGTLIVSGYATPEETARASRLGVGGYLRKPFKTRDLLEQIQRILKTDAEGRRHQERGSALQAAFFWGLESLARLADHLALLAPGGSLLRTGHLVEAIGRELGLDPEVTRQVRLAAMTVDLLEHPALPRPPFFEDDVAPALRTALAHWRFRYEEHSDQPFEARVLAVALAASRGLEEEAALPSAADLEQKEPGRFDPAVLQAYELARGARPQPPAAPAPEAHTGSLLSLARALRQAGDHENAWRAYEQVIGGEAAPGPSVEALLGQAELAMHRGEVDRCRAQALEAVHRARLLGPVASAGVYLQGGLLLFRAGSSDAETILSQAVSRSQMLGLSGGEALARVALARMEGGSGAELSQSLSALADPHHYSEVVRASEWLLPALLELACDDAALVALRLADNLPGSLEALLERGLPPETRHRLVETILTRGVLTSPGVVERLCADPDEAVRARAASLRDRVVSTAGTALLRVHSLGVFQVFRGDQRVEEAAWKSPRVKYLFGLLASRWGRPIPDERIMDDFWPEQELDKARRSLYWSTSMLRRCLRQEGAGPGELVLRQREALLLDPEVLRWHDLEELERACEAGGLADEQGRPEEASVHFRRLAQLYTGPFMDGCYMEWALQRRTEVEHLVVEGLSRLAALALQRKHHAEALEAARTVLTVAPARQESHLQVMQALLGLREPEKAVEQFRACERLLRREYEMEPSIELLEYYHRARLGMCEG